MSAAIEADTIAAIASGSGEGGVGIVRISGPEALTIAEAIVGRSLPDRQIVYAVARTRSGQRIDDVIAFALHAPRSFTGEHVAELQGHGGLINMAQLLGAALERGARAAEAGEFTRRAFANGRLDLARAEALRQVIAAGSERAWRVAQSQLAGELGNEVARLRERALMPLVEIEAACDFPDDDLAVRDATWLVPELAAVANRSAALAATYRAGRLLDRGIQVALVGPVNVGKSSLLNALIGHERALVAAEPGTTRDYVEAQCVWNGVRVTLVDTAGLRHGDSVGTVEQRGIAMGQARTTQADVVLVVTETGASMPNSSVHGDRALMVWSKCDADSEEVLDQAALANGVRTSAQRGLGLNALRQAILTKAGASGEGSEMVITSERQHGLLTLASEHLRAAATGLGAGQPMEMIALDVRQAVRELAEVAGEEVGEAVLDQIFARFCIGK